MSSEVSWIWLSKDGLRVYISPEHYSNQNDQDISSQVILQWLMTHGLQDLFIIETNLSKAIENLNQTSLENDKEILIAERRDGTIELEISQDKMKVTLKVKGAYGGKNIDGKSIIERMTKTSIKTGIKKNVVKSAIHNSLLLKPGETIEAVISEGKPPTEGEAGYIEFLVQDHRKRLLKPKKRNDGTVDMRDLGRTIMVKKGELLAKVHSPGHGRSGINVHGETIAPIAGESVSLKAYPNTEFKGTHQNKLFSSADGLPLIHTDGVEIEETLNIDSVTVATGHVFFDGNVIVSGDVHPQMKIVAKGSVTIGGLVDMANIKATHDIIVHGGIIGKSADSEEILGATLKSQKGKIISKFAQYADLTSKSDLHIEQILMHCKTKVGGNLSIYDSTKRNGSLIGGRHQVAGSVSAAIIGTPSHVPTHICAHMMLEIFISEKRELEAAIEQTEKIIHSIKQTEKKLMALSETDKSKKAIETLAWNKNEQIKLLSNFKAQEKKETRTLPELYRQHVIESYRSFYPGVLCEIGDDKIKLDHDRTAIQIVATVTGIKIETPSKR